MIRLTLSLLWVGLLTSVASAAGPAWQYRVKDRVEPGHKAELILGAGNDVHDIEVLLEGPDGARKRFTIKKLKAGRTKTLRWAVPAGISEWSGSLKGSADGATTTAAVNIKVAAVRPLDVRLSKKDVDLAGGRVLIHPSHAVARAEVKAWGEGGAVIVDEEVDLGGATGAVPVEFTVAEGDVIKRLELKIHDPYGFWAGLRVVSWFAEIPHEDVIFESGKWDIRPEEAPKIDDVFSTLHSEIARFKKELGTDAVKVDLKIYVAGFTDTVGSPPDNRLLSERRARAIARYFRAHGAKLPIFYQGFGEAALAEPTADDVDNARNRRATYVLANVPPGGRAFPGARWKPLD